MASMFLYADEIVTAFKLGGVISSASMCRYFNRMTPIDLRPLKLGSAI